MTPKPRHPEAIERYWATRRAQPRTALNYFRAGVQYLLNTGRVTPQKAGSLHAEAYHALTEVELQVTRARYQDGDYTVDSKLGLHPDASMAFPR